MLGDLVEQFVGCQPHGGVFAFPLLDAVAVDEDESVAGQVGVHAVTKGVVSAGDGAVVQQERCFPLRIGSCLR